MDRTSARRALISSWLVVVVVLIASSFSPGAAAIDGLVGSERLKAERSEGGETATLSIRAFDAKDGTPLAVRARLVPRKLLGESQVHVDATGRIDLELSPGEYDLVVSHGPEWSLYEAPIALARGSRRALRVALSRAVNAERFSACDLHVHSAHSNDADVSLAERAASLKAEDVHFAILTEHNAITSEAVSALGALGIGSLPGVEVTTWEPEFGHFNVFPARRAPRYRHTHEAALLSELRRDPEAFVQINHPRLEEHIGYFALHPPSKHKPLPFDGVEVWNGYDLTRPERRDALFREWLGLLARGQRIAATGGSDSHHMRLPFVGYPRTYVDVPRAQARDGKRVLAALRAGRSFISSGPILALSAEGHVPGDTLNVSAGQGEIAVELRVDGPAWMDLTHVELWLDQERVVSAELAEHEPRNAPLRFKLSLAQQRSLVAVVRGERGMRALIGRGSAEPYAFTNPIWIRHRK